MKKKIEFGQLKKFVSWTQAAGLPKIASTTSLVWFTRWNRSQICFCKERVNNIWSTALNTHLWLKSLQKTLIFVGKPVAETKFQLWLWYFLQQPSTATCHQTSAIGNSRVTNRTFDFGGICLVGPPRANPWRPANQDQNMWHDERDPTHPTFTSCIEKRLGEWGGLDPPAQRDIRALKDHRTLLDAQSWPFPACSLSLSLFPTYLSLQIKSV